MGAPISRDPEATWIRVRQPRESSVERCTGGLPLLRMKFFEKQGHHLLTSTVRRHTLDATIGEGTSTCTQMMQSFAQFYLLSLGVLKASIKTLVNRSLVRLRGEFCQ